MQSESDLARRIRNGDRVEEARHDLVQANLRLVVAITRALGESDL
jgi:DNA-directed RNA polymerase sigma subunit (sigma70/sigma32)